MGDIRSRLRAYNDISDAVVWAEPERQFSPAVQQRITDGFSMVNGREITRHDMLRLTLEEAKGYVRAVRQAEAAENKRSKLPKFLSLSAAALLVVAIGGGVLLTRPDSKADQRSASSLSADEQDDANTIKSNNVASEQTATASTPTPASTPAPAATAAVTTPSTAPKTTSASTSKPVVNVYANQATPTPSGPSAAEQAAADAQALAEAQAAAEAQAKADAEKAAKEKMCENDPTLEMCLV